MRSSMFVVLLVLAACASPAPAAQTPALTPGSGDLVPYRAAMRPEFAADVERFAQATRYRIDLSISPDLTTIRGRQQVHYTNTEDAALDRVYFRLLANTASYGGQQVIESVRVNGGEVKLAMELQDSAMRIDLDPPLQPGHAVDFEMEYRVAVPDVSIGAGYDQFGYHGGVLTLPNVYPIIPVYDDEGWNVELAPGYGDAVYSDTSLYQVSITAPAEQTVVASGVCDVSSEGANRVWRCVSGPMRDFMIVMSADFVVESTQVDGVAIHSYALERDVPGGVRGAKIAAEAVRSYQARIGAYPFTELDLVETPTTAGGIEYPGLIVVAERLYDDAPTQEFTTVHEVAHQWWYSLVGNDQVDEPWIDEALAQYTSILYYRDRYGAEQAQFVTGLVFGERYDRARQDSEDLPADLPVAGYSPEQYGQIVYGKAPLFFEALYRAMGDEKFNAFLKAYFESRRYGIATAQHLLDVAATQLDRATIDQLLQKWIKSPEN